MNLPQACILPTQRQILGVLSSRLGVRLAPPAQRAQFSGLTRGDAEDLLDWLESQGISGQVSLSKGGSGFTVEYQRRA
jgi:hypothetical protein